MKKVVPFLVFSLLALLALPLASAVTTECNLDAELLNQDPYPANPGDYVKLVFQVNGVVNPDCGKISFRFIEDFPFYLDPGAKSIKEISGGTYVRNFGNTFLIPYDVRVDENALDGDNTVEASIIFQREDGEIVSQIEQFEINVQGVTVDFEVLVKDFDSATNTLTFEMLNIGENDVEALVVEVPKQDNVIVKGPSSNIVGDLDSNEDASFKFEAVPQDGEIELVIKYNDQINVRREVMLNVLYDSSYFTDRKADEVQPKPTSYYLLIVLIVLIVVVWIWKRWKKKKQRMKDYAAGKKRK